ncbi:MAG: hypothetical protein H6588_00325 [Flavobacteriales bacterium]|nr:hypothetical protein [Flavobacteriales bacterium]
MDKRELYSAIITFDSNQVLTVRFKNNVDVDLTEMVKLVDVSLELVNGTPFYLLVDARNILSNMSHGAREYITKHKEYARLNIAQAIIVNNMPVKILANFYMKFYKQPNPVKMFGDITEGKKWLLSQ